MVFDGKGNIWFTSQGSNRVGRLNMTTEKVDLVVPNDTPSNPYGIVMHKGAPYVALLRTNTIAKVDPNDAGRDEVQVRERGSRSRRVGRAARRHGVVRRRGARLHRAHQSGDR